MTTQEQLAFIRQLQVVMYDFQQKVPSFGPGNECVDMILHCLGVVEWALVFRKEEK